MIDIEGVKRKLLDQLSESGWRAVLKGILLSSEFDHILDSLVAEKDAGRRFTPTIGEIFEAFVYCPYDSLQLVIVADEPYNEFGWASGIAFDCSNVKKEHYHLKVIFDSISDQYSLPGYKRNVDLKRWSKQGILLLNSALTARIDKPGKHHEIWKPFTAYVMDILNIYPRNLVFVFMGDKAAGFADLIGNEHKKLYVEHPRQAYNNDGDKWFDNALFMEIDNSLDKPIKW